MLQTVLTFLEHHVAGGPVSRKEKNSEKINSFHTWRCRGSTDENMALILAYCIQIGSIVYRGQCCLRSLAYCKAS